MTKEEKNLYKIINNLPISISEYCRKNHLQMCHICDDIDCCDNISKARNKIDELEKKLERCYEFLTDDQLIKMK